jgi:hypothetical protein
MGKRRPLEPCLSATELERRYRTAKESHERSWWQIVWLLATGHTAATVAEVTGYSRDWSGQLVRRHNTQGSTAMHTRQYTTSWRAQPMLPIDQQEELGTTPGAPQRGEHCKASGALTARAVATWMSVNLGRPVRVQQGWDDLQRAEISQLCAAIVSMRRELR